MQTRYAEPIFGVAFELAQKPLANCYKRLSSEDANYYYLSSVVVRASVKCLHRCLKVIIINIILSKVIYKHCYLMQLKYRSPIFYFQLHVGLC